MRKGRKCNETTDADLAASNGVLNRRIFLEGALLAGAAGAAGAGVSDARAEPLAVPRWMKEPGAQFTAYGQPSRFEAKVVRAFAAAGQPDVAVRLLNRVRQPLMELPKLQAVDGAVQFDLPFARFPKGDYLLEIRAVSGAEIVMTFPRPEPTTTAPDSPSRMSFRAMRTEPRCSPALTVTISPSAARSTAD